MSRRSGAGGEPAKSQRHKAVTPKRRSAPESVGARSSSVAGQETEVARLTRELREGQEQQRATSEILGVVARSRTDVQSVLDTVCRSAAQLCEAYDASVWRPDGDRRRPQPEDAVGKRIWSRPRAAHAQPLKRHGRATIAY